MKKNQTIKIIFAIILTINLAGCDEKFLDPAQVGRFRPVPAVNVILESLGVAEEAPSPWETAEDPKPIDVMIFETDYVLGPGDVIRVSIFELLTEERPFENTYIITETGKISISEVGIIEAAGLTETQLEDRIKQILSPSILKEPLVTVVALRLEQRTFTITGQNVPQPGRYDIPRYDFRLTDAIAISGVRTQFNTSYIFVTRTITGNEAIGERGEVDFSEQSELEQFTVPETEVLEIIAPSAQRTTHAGNLVIASAEMITNDELAEMAMPENFEITPVDEGPSPQEGLESLLKTLGTPSDRETIAPPLNREEAGHIEWVFQDGKWIPVQVGEPRMREPLIEQRKIATHLQKKVPESFDWDQVGGAGLQVRVIRIPTDKLFGGDPRYNIVIRPKDNIHVPVDVIGEYFVFGNTNSQGAVPLTGRPLTLKMAISAAGGLGPLAWPKRCEITRRIGKKKEETVMVDMDKIFSGEQPDFFIKPLDLINVGTHPTARWRAVLRNAFRATYGFGFIYDRNFGERDFGVHAPFGPFSSGWDPF